MREYLFAIVLASGLVLTLVVRSYDPDSLQWEVVAGTAGGLLTVYVIKYLEIL